jgi:adenylate cyclase
MAVEIERKFLVADDRWKQLATKSTAIRQAYIAMTDTVSVRVRIKDDAQAQLTIKSAGATRTRSEFEYPVSVDDARDMMRLRDGAVLEKRRHNVPIDGLTWEVDVFEGVLAGLVIAEVELPDENTPFRHPDWLGEEVTGDRRYYNAALSRNGAPRHGPASVQSSRASIAD